MRTTIRYGVVSLGLSAGLWALACGDTDSVEPVEDASVVPPPVAPDGATVDGAVPVGIVGRATVEVEHYDYALDLATRSAKTRLRLRVVSPGRCVELPFRAESPSEVAFDNVGTREVAVVDGKLSACVRGEDPGFNAGATVTLSVRSVVPQTTLGTLQVGYSKTKDSAGGDFTYLLSWVGGCDRFGPCDTNPGVFATYHFAVDHPTTTRVLCPGTIVPQITGGHTDCDFAFRGGPTYSTFGLMAGERWLQSSLGASGNVNLELFDLDGADLRSSLDPVRLRGMLAFLVSKLGPYPYGNELRFVVAPTVWAGFEHPGNITLAQTLFGTGAEHVAFHEMAHQWAGDQTTIFQKRDFVWKEAMAEYLAFVYEATLGEPRAASTARTWKDSSLALPHHPVPTTEVPIEEAYGSAYGPGPLVLFRQLEVRYSREAVLAALGQVLGKPRTLSLDELRKALEATTGANLVAYFEGWLVGDGKPSWPTVRVTKNTLAADLVAIVLTPKKKGRGLKFVVRLEGALAGQRLDVTLDTGIDGAGPTSYTARPGFVTTRIAVDPDAQALVFEEGTRGAFGPETPVRPWLAPPAR